MLNRRETEALASFVDRKVRGQVTILGARRTEEQAKVVRKAASAFIKEGFLVRTTGNRNTDADVFLQAVEEDVEGSILVTLPWVQEPRSGPELDPTGQKRRLGVNEWAILLGELQVDEATGEPLEAQATEEERAAAKHVFKSSQRYENGQPAVDGKGAPILLTPAQTEGRARGEHRRFVGLLKDSARWRLAIEGGVARFRALSMSSVDNERFVRDGIDPLDYQLAEGLAAGQDPVVWDKMRKADRKRRTADLLAVGAGEDLTDLLLWLPDMESIGGGSIKKAAEYARKSGVPTLLLSRSTEDSITEFCHEVAKFRQEAPQKSVPQTSESVTDEDEGMELASE